MSQNSEQGLRHIATVRARECRNFLSAGVSGFVAVVFLLAPLCVQAQSATPSALVVRYCVAYQQCLAEDRREGAAATHCDAVFALHATYCTERSTSQPGATDVLHMEGTLRALEDSSATASLEEGPRAAIGRLQTLSDLSEDPRDFVPDIASGFADIATLGAASFLLHRAQAEVQMLVYRLIRDSICSDNAVRSNWLRETCALVSREHGAVGTFGRALFDSVAHDVEDMPLRLIAAASENASSTLPSEVQTALRVLAELLQSGDPLRALDTGSDGLVASSTSAWGSLLDRARLARDLHGEVSAAAREYTCAGQTGTALSSCREQMEGLTQAYQALEVVTDEGLSGDLRIRAVSAVASGVFRAVRSALSSSSNADALARIERLSRVAESLAAGDWPGALASVVGSVADTNVSVPPQALRLMMIVTELLSARTANEFEAAMDVLAEPMGASAVRYQGFTTAIAGFVGAGGGGLFRSESDLAPSESEWIGSGVLALGLDLSWALPHTDWYLGVLLNVLDLAAIVSFGPDQLVSSDPLVRREDVAMERVFAPGFFIHTGWREVDFLTLGAGMTISPFAGSLHRPMEGEEEANAQVVEARLLVFLAVDIPIFVLN